MYKCPANADENCNIIEPGKEEKSEERKALELAVKYVECKRCPLYPTTQSEICSKTPMIKLEEKCRNMLVEYFLSEARMK